MVEVIKKKFFNKKVMFVILGFAFFVFSLTGILQRVELSQQKPRVMNGIKNAFLSLTDERYQVTELLELLDGGKLEIDGLLTINYMNSPYISEDIQKNIVGSKISFDILRDEVRREMSFNMAYSYLGVELFSGIGYLDQDQLFLKIPEIHPGTFAIDTQNIKEQLESSLMYTYLGNQAPQLENEFSINGFPEYEIPKDMSMKSLLDGYLESNLEVLKQVYNVIQVEKLDYKKEMIYGSQYKSSTPYSVLIPKEEGRLFINSLGNYFNINDYLKNINEDIKFVVYLDQAKEISGLEIELILNIDNTVEKVKCFFDFLGDESNFDKVDLKLEFLEKDNNYKVSIHNIFEDTIRNTKIDLKMEKPYQVSLLSLNQEYNMETGESKYLYDINVAGVLIGEGSFHLGLLEEEIEHPTEYPIKIFELDILNLLKVLNEMNLSFFQ